ncbi:hypothetical protein [Luteibacter sp. 329MFSha]|uniref:hypothetical protein n=1 Tax=Luteibacter sp. 329MFSha TaxID=1798239 RepID=UPI0008BFF854|nr:hypothetical protein [Luteibacter sp. 329MFSha]SEV96477.1 hypothetical protein SAMN04515660_1354 [Luteibacter sp. 329MFSha]
MAKEDQTGLETVRALGLVIRWMQEETSNGKVRQALTVLAEQTQARLEQGKDIPEADVAQLAAWHSDRFGGPWKHQTATGRWLPSEQSRTWWETRQISRRQFLASHGCHLDVVLSVDKGGGRGNATLYRYGFLAFEPSEGEPPLEDKERLRPGTGFRLAYEVEEARATLLLRPFIGRPFAIRSWRGVFFILSLAIPFAACLFCALGAAALVLAHSPSLKASFSPLVTVAAVGGLLTWRLRPFWSLPMLRVTVAPDLMLAMSQIYGQFRLSHDEKRKKTGGRFSLVRHWSTCPICAGMVEIRDGGKAFPGRLVGCCSDSPREHVYSFDAVTLTGALLIDRNS